MALKQLADGTWIDDPGSANTAYGAGLTSAPAATPAPIDATVNQPGIPASETTEIAYITGINANGTLATRSFFTDQGTVAHKWGANTAGMPSGTITYSFSGYDATQQATLTEALNLWSAVANVTFAYQATGGAYTLALGSNGAADTSASYRQQGGGNRIATTTAVTTAIDPKTPGFELDGSFQTQHGYGISTAVHEIGHALGFGHAGDYNATVNTSTQQLGPYDSRLWSVMSYIDPSDTNAQYYGSYPVTGTNWGGTQSPTTMQILDILGMQELYGVSASGVLGGGQVFGFHTNIASSIRNFFDFTVNTTPVITIWDGGTGNTLDLSGYTAAATVDLRPGTFSSADGLTNNIGIAYNTVIDTAVGGSGDDRFTVNSGFDTITGGGGMDQVVFAGNRADYTLSRNNNVVGVLKGNVVDTLNDITTLVFADSTVQTSDIPCFVRGTRIGVPGGERAVEELTAGDLVLSAAGAALPVRWIGTRSYAGRFLSARVRPVRIGAGSLGGGLPRRDLLVSPAHAMLLDGALVPAAALIDGMTIMRETALAEVDYFHIELDGHEIVLAEGAATETFVDDDSRGLFHNAASYTGPANHRATFCAPRLESGFALDAIRRRIGGKRAA